MKKKLIIVIIPLLLLGGVYKFVLAKPKVKAKKPHVEGTIYLLQKEFLVNLSGEGYAKISAALLLSHDDTSVAVAGGHGAAVPPEGYGAMTQEAVVRAIITDALTGQPTAELKDTKKRDKLRKDIVERIHKETDVKAEEILFPDLTVQ
jgi:flagellar basal body-associated protein FliL